jgi:hypothetical protein
VTSRVWGDRGESKSRKDEEASFIEYKNKGRCREPPEYKLGVTRRRNGTAEFIGGLRSWLHKNGRSNSNVSDRHLDLN